MITADKNKHISAAILAGGKSSRIGSDKAFLKFDDSTFLEHIVKILSVIFNEVIIISDHYERYEYLNIPIYPDIYKESGPLAGIHSAFINTNSELVFITTCDNPFIAPETIRHLANINSSDDAIVYSSDDNIQPLFGVYKRNCLPMLIEQLETKHLSAIEFLKKVKTKFINPINLPFDAENIFFNVNTLKDYKIAIEKYEKRK